MTRFFPRQIIFVLAAMAGILSLASCERTTAPAEPKDFGSIRILNAAECMPNFDVFITSEAGTRQAPTYSLAYGHATAYYSNLPTNGTVMRYHLKATVIGDTNKTLLETDINLRPNEKYTWAIFGDGSAYTGKVLTDGITVQDGTDPNAHVRFLNVSKEPLSLVIGDPLNGTILGPLNYKDVAPADGYQSLRFATDTGYSLFVVKPGTTDIVARLAGVAMASGNFYTVTYGGDTCKLQSNASPNGDAVDSLRVRVYDDNDIGNDQTFSLPKTLVFNFINGLIPVEDASPTQLTYQEMGVVINNDNLITFPGLSPFDGAPNERPIAEKVYNISYLSIPLTDAISVKAFRTDNVEAKQRGDLLLDYRAGRRALVKSDFPVSIIVVDTVVNPGNKVVADSARVNQIIVPVPDQPIAGMARLVEVNGLTPLRKVLSQLPSKGLWSVNGVEDPKMTGTRRSFNTETDPNATNDVAAGQTTISIVLAKSTNPAFNEETITKTFTADAGGIYEVVLLGQRGNSKYPPTIVVYRTNASN